MKLPLTQSDSTRPIYQADGKLFSFTEHAQEIIAALNFVHGIATIPDSEAGRVLLDLNQGLFLPTLIEQAQEIVGERE